MQKPPDHTKIGIIAWGTKRGRSTFFSSDTIAVKNPAIQRTLKDIHTVMRFQDPEIEFYGLEFTADYRVCTLYRTLYDWANGPGYLALTLYIPHQVADGFEVLDLLHQLRDLYIANYMDASYRLSKIPENAALFFDLIAKTPLALKEKNAAWAASPENNERGVIFYKNTIDLGKVFKNPYQSKYSQYEKVLCFQEDTKGAFGHLKTIAGTVAPTVVVATPIVKPQVKSQSKPLTSVDDKEIPAKIKSTPTVSPIIKKKAPKIVKREKLSTETPQIKKVQSTSFFKLIVLAGIVTLGFVSWSIFNKNSKEAIEPVEKIENNKDKNSSKSSEIPKGIQKDFDSIEAKKKALVQRDSIAHAKIAKRDSIESIGVIKKQREENELKKKIKRVQAFASSANFNVKRAEIYIKYLKKGKVKEVAAKENIDLAFLTKRLRNMSSIGAAMYNFMNFQDLPEDARASSRIDYREIVAKLHNNNIFSKAQNIFIKKWLEEN